MTSHRTYQGGTVLEGLGGPVHVDPYTFDGIDPTLDSCCQREIESNRKYNALKATLQRHDVAALAERRKRNLVVTPSFDGCRCCYDPSVDGHYGDYAALLEYKHQLQPNTEDSPTTNNNNNHHENATEEQDTSDNDSDDEFDYLLDEDFSATAFDHDENNNRYSLKEAEDARRAQLEWEILQRQVAIQHGYGTHRPLHPTRVLKVAGLGASSSSRPPPPAVVLHLIDPDSVSSASLDYFLETRLAENYPGTIFLRSDGRFTLLMNVELAQKHLSAILASSTSSSSTNSDLPALVAIRDGQVVNISKGLDDVCQHQGGPVEPRAVEMWLEQSGVLRDQPPSYDSLCFVRPEEEALMEYLGQKKSNEPKEREEHYYFCGVDGCSKTFPHEHVGIKTSAQDGLVLKEDTILGKNEVIG